MVVMACLGGALPGFAQEANPEAPTSQGFISSLLERAKTYIGTPYRYGGTGPNGFDCSGFVRFVFGAFGIHLNHSSRAQASQGDSVDLDQIQPGDLLFFKTQGNHISHVGIYLGGGQFIEAGSWGGPGKRGVKITQLDSSYYAGRLVSARRLMITPNETPQLLDQLIPQHLLQQEKAAQDQ
jgi:cell wall-associated NlpC family hydrolase